MYVSICASSRYRNCSLLVATDCVRCVCMCVEVCVYVCVSNNCVFKTQSPGQSTTTGKKTVSITFFSLCLEDKIVSYCVRVGRHLCLAIITIYENCFQSQCECVSKDCVCKT